MIRLGRRAFAIFGIRWIRSWGYRGSHPATVIVVAMVVAVGGAIGVAWWANGQFANLAEQSRQFRDPLVGVVIIMLFFSAGPVLLLTESLRTSGSKIQAVLSALPLTGREITLLMWLPTFVVSLALLAVLWLPGLAAISGLQFSAYQSVIGSLLALLSGYCLAALIVAGIRILLARGTWAVVQYPVMVLAWMALNGLELWRTGDLSPTSVLSPGDYLLLVPWLLRETVREPIPLLQVGAIGLGTLAAIGFLVWSASLPSEGKHVSVAWQWSRRWRLPLVTLELTRILRSRHLVANLIGAEMIMIGTSIALWKLPLFLRPFIAKPLLAFMMLTAALPLLAIRGLTRGRFPVPLVLGYGPIQWTASQVVAGYGVAVAAAVPGAVAFGLLGLPISTIATYTLPVIVASCGVAIALGWSAPASADNPVGQIVGTFLLVLVLGAVVIVADHAFTSGTAMWALFFVVIGSLGVAWAALLERERWYRVVASGGSHVN